MKKLILLAIAFSWCPTNIFSQDTIDTTITNTPVDTLFNTIYYKDGSISKHSNLVFSTSWGYNEKLKLFSAETVMREPALWESQKNINFDEDAETGIIIDTDNIEKIVRKDGEVISGDKIRKRFKILSAAFTTITYVLPVIIIISLVLLA